MAEQSKETARGEAIRIEHLWAGYDAEQVLEDVTFYVDELDFVGLIGPNGGGKTTLIKVILGLLPPTRGTVRIMGQPVHKGRRYIGYVPQILDFDLSFPLRSWEVVRMGRLGRRRLFQRYTAADDHVVNEMLDRVDMLDLRDRPIGQLSGGQRQRILIARALATEPRILLLDEPTASIDPNIRTSIYELLRELNDHVTIVLISHDMSAISSYVKTVGCLNRHLFYHSDAQLDAEMLELAYQCPIDLIAHGVPHRVFPMHGGTTVHQHGGRSGHD